MKVGILADDLTSATDGAAPFVSMGHRCVVFADYGQSLSGEVAIVSVNKASRTASLEEAAERAAKAAADLASADILYNTVDSTIRGHLAVEITSALAASGRSLAVLAPAFPEGGRTTEGGRQLLRGVPLENTEFACDPLHPVGNSHIRTLFPDIPDIDVRVMGLSEIHALKSGDLAADGRTLLIADAVTQDDLALLVQSAKDPKSILWCGSPGLAIALAKHIGWAADDPASKGPLNLFVIGSVNPLSREQYTRLVGASDVWSIIIDAEEASRSPVLAARNAIALHESRSGSPGTIILTTSSGPAAVNPRTIATALGHAARELVKHHPVTGLFLTGGDTAETVLGELEIGSLELLGEVEPGIPIGRTTGAHPIHIITKAGGFGSAHVLQKSAEVLRGLWLGEKK
ncbi:four-carbon acid sugar kinase family protein [Mesorhizobium sp. ANAO-SY3R2]|uniref:four-carbon acid sugar kinase family protein n=1 Tax=Mesorhizobium sp. ANAO-SY3R2 TaxID=3166644 RepID=UPI003671535E